MCVECIQLPVLLSYVIYFRNEKIVIQKKVSNEKRITKLKW